MQKKEKDLKTIINSGNMFRKNLSNKSLLIISGSINAPNVNEIEFQNSNFLHLTGVVTKVNANNFMRMLEKSRIKISDWDYRKDGTTQLKLRILPDIVNIHNRAKMIGVYDKRRVFMSTDLCIGNTFCYLGLIKTNRITNRNNNVYVPNTSIASNIISDTNSRERILAIYRKDKNKIKYDDLTYLAKGIDKQYIEEVFKNYF
ncbi:PBECR4 domain-containing protein [Peptoniphilus sp. SGI.035]|uniref:PBECR4 domain-containing protein n=1 Tax=Peptoniphilus sp. SGI.035 TaxID=3420564 RepID=UPI003CFFF975